MDAPQGGGITLGGSDSGQQNGLVASQSCRSFDGTRVATIELHILFGASDEEGTSLGEDIQASEVHITAIEQIKRSGFGKQLVQNVDVVDLASSHINIGRNAAPQIQQRMQFHRALAAAKFSPREKRQAQIDGRGVQGIHGLGQFHSERFVVVEVASGGNQDLSEIGVDPPVAMLVGVGQSVARNLATEAHVIELGLLGTKTGFDIAETFAVGELSKGQTEELIPAGEIFDVAIALVAIDANLKRVGWEEVHKLRKDGSAKIHLLPPEHAGKQ